MAKIKIYKQKIVTEKTDGPEYRRLKKTDQTKNFYLYLIFLER